MQYLISLLLFSGLLKSPPFDDEINNKTTTTTKKECDDEVVAAVDEKPFVAPPPDTQSPPSPLPPPPPRQKKPRRRRHSSGSALTRGSSGGGGGPPTGARGHLASQPGLDPEALSDMSVRGLDLLRYSQISEDGSYRCLECEKAEISKSFKNKYSFQRHAFLYHEGTQRKVFPCPVCGKEFSRPDKMKQHLRQVHDCIIPKGEAGEGGDGDGLGGPGHFLLNPFLGSLEDLHHHHHHHHLVEGKLGSRLQEATSAAAGSEVFKLMSRLAAGGAASGHGAHAGQGAS